MIDLSKRWQVIEGDCLEVLKQLPDRCVDAVVTDPPYGIPVGSAFVKAGFTVTDGAGVFNEARCDKWLSLLNCVIDGGNVAYFHARGDEPKSDTIDPWHRFYWVKPSVPVTPRPCFASAVEECTIGQRRGTRRWFGGGWCPNYWSGLSPARLGNGSGHPSEKPTELMRVLIQALSEPGGLVLDPFCGSGTTGVACMQTGRRFVGIEIDPGYAAIARRRISQAAETLWTPPEPPQPVPELFP